MNRLCVIVIPIYKAEPNIYERTSFARCCRILGKEGGNYPIYLLTHDRLDLSVYREIAQTHGTVFQTEFFPTSSFKNIHTYNCLMLNSNFYSRFARFEYMLLYQLDAYVFRDELETWCRRGYDYVGPPLFTPGHFGTLEWSTVGNGGLSLRKISAFQQASGGNGPLSWSKVFRSRPPRHPYITSKRRVFYFLMLATTGRCHWLRNLFTYFVYEDRFYSFALQGSAFELHVPASREALSFAYDMDPAFCHMATAGQLPFGCHGYDKRYDRFYSAFIPLEE